MTPKQYTLTNIALFLRDEWGVLEGRMFNSNQIEWVDFFIEQYEEWQKEQEKE